jgi:ABC-type Fe3+ transport system permease subunit
MIVITDLAVPLMTTLTALTLIEVSVTGNVEARTRDAGAQRRVAARETHTDRRKAALVLVFAAIAAVHVVLVVVVVDIIAAQHETSQFQQDGSQLFTADISPDRSRIAERKGTGISRCGV